MVLAIFLAVTSLLAVSCFENAEENDSTAILGLVVGSTESSTASNGSSTSSSVSNYVIVGSALWQIDSDIGFVAYSKAKSDCEDIGMRLPTKNDFNNLRANANSSDIKRILPGNTGNTTGSFFPYYWSSNVATNADVQTAYAECFAGKEAYGKNLDITPVGCSGSATICSKPINITGTNHYYYVTILESVSYEGRRINSINNTPEGYATCVRDI